MCSLRRMGVLRLAETQSAIRNAIVSGEAHAILARLTGGGDLRYRLSIHQRHFEASLVTTLRTRYPTLEWLVGGAFFVAAAAAFVRRYPPAVPCIAEYGEAFPDFLADGRGTRRMPWLAEAGRLEWLIGAVSVETSRFAIPLDALGAFDDVDPGDIGLTLQPGLRYLAGDWPVDELIRIRLSGTPPERLVFDRGRVRLQVRGARGEFGIDRLTDGDFAFRASLAAAMSLDASLAAGAAAAPDFDAGLALAELFAGGLVTAIHNLKEGSLQ